MGVGGVGTFPPPPGTRAPVCSLRSGAFWGRKRFFFFGYPRGGPTGRRYFGRNMRVRDKWETKATIRDRVVGLERVRAGDLAPHPKNWRTHPERQSAALQGVLADVGIADACIARRLADGRLQLIDGHLRSSLDPDQVLPVLVLDVDEQEAELLLATLDPIAALAGADRRQLGELLSATVQVNPDVQALLERLAADHRLEIDQHEAAADRVGDPPKKAITRLGDVWQLGPHRLVCGDATGAEVTTAAVAGRAVALVFTDPPYGVDYAGRPGTPRDKIAGDGSDSKALRTLLVDSLRSAAEVSRAGAPIYVCSADQQVVVFRESLESAGWRYAQTLVWVKNHFVLGRADYHQQHEPILYGWKPAGGGAVWEARLVRRPPAIDDLMRSCRLHVSLAAQQQAKSPEWSGDLQRRRDNGDDRRPRRRDRPARPRDFDRLAIRSSCGQSRAPDHEAGRLDSPSAAQQQPAGRAGARPVCRLRLDTDGVRAGWAQLRCGGDRAKILRRHY